MGVIERYRLETRNEIMKQKTKRKIKLSPNFKDSLGLKEENMTNIDRLFHMQL